MKPFLLLLLTSLVLTAAQAQQPGVDLSTLPLEDQAVVKALKFKAADLAPEESRSNTFIKAEIPVNNSGPKEGVLGKLNIEGRMLFHTPDREWAVLKCQSDFAITTKGMSQVHISFEDTNKHIEAIAGDKKARVEDSYTVIRYAGVTIFESEPSKASRFPVEWWKKEGKLAKEAAPGKTAPGKVVPGKKAGDPVGEFQALRALAVRDLRAQAWRTYEQGVTALNGKYLAAIDKAMKTSQSYSLLDEALALRKEKETVAQTGRVPSGPAPQNAPALASLRATYVGALTGLKTVRAQASEPVLEDYGQKVELLIERLTREGKLDEAKAARDGKNAPLIAED